MELGFDLDNIEFVTFYTGVKRKQVGLYFKELMKFSLSSISNF